MPKSRKPLTKPRQSAFSKQKGLCYYCDQPMWNGSPISFGDKYGLTVRQAQRFQCTGEHLVAHKDGGGVGKGNIVAACLFCNAGRHRRKTDLGPERFRSLVQRRMSAGRWHHARPGL